MWLVLLEKRVKVYARSCNEDSLSIRDGTIEVGHEVLWKNELRHVCTNYSVRKGLLLACMACQGCDLCGTRMRLDYNQAR